MIDSFYLSVFDIILSTGVGYYYLSIRPKWCLGYAILRREREMIRMPKITVKPGEIVPVSGQWKPVGGDTEVTLVKDTKVPPNNGKGLQKFILVDKTKHKD